MPTSNRLGAEGQNLTINCSTANTASTAILGDFLVCSVPAALAWRLMLLPDCTTAVILESAPAAVELRRPVATVVSPAKLGNWRVGASLASKVARADPTSCEQPKVRASRDWKRECSIRSSDRDFPRRSVQLNKDAME
jgi:hypothetical protein